MAIRSAVAGLMPLICACASAQPAAAVHLGGPAGPATGKPEKLEPFVAPPEPLPPPPSVTAMLPGDPRFLISERPELHAFVLMVLPTARHRTELLAVLDAWLRDESLLGESPMRDVPCADGAVCLTLPPHDQESLIQRIRTGIGRDAEGIGRATARARSQIIDILKGPPGIAEIVLSGAPSFEHLGVRYFDLVGPSALGPAIQDLLEHSTLCLVVPSVSSVPGATLGDPGHEANHSPHRPGPIESREVLLVVRATGDKPYLAWSIQSPGPEGQRQSDTLAAEVILARLGEQEPKNSWSRFARLAGAGRSVDEEQLVDSIQELQGAFARSGDAARESEMALRAAESHRVDFGSCERSMTAPAQTNQKADIVVVGPTSLAPRLEAAGISVRVVAPPR